MIPLVSISEAAAVAAGAAATCPLPCDVLACRVRAYLVRLRACAGGAVAGAGGGDGLVARLFVRGRAAHRGLQQELLLLVRHYGGSAAASADTTQSEVASKENAAEATIDAATHA